jgi:hypothetical protein
MGALFRAVVSGEPILPKMRTCDIHFAESSARRQRHSPLGIMVRMLHRGAREDRIERMEFGRDSWDVCRCTWPLIAARMTTLKLGKAAVNNGSGKE